MHWDTFAAFDADYKFSEKAGFHLSDKQIEKVHQALAWDKYLNKLDVGCGKTVISTVISLMKGREITIVTCPPILISGWVSWLNQVSERAVAYEGSTRKTLDLSTVRWIVVSHAIFRLDFKLLMSAVLRREGSRYADREVIVDEAHWLKNSQTVLYKYVKSMSQGNYGLQLLTGTPVTKPVDTFAYLSFTRPEAYKSKTAFLNTHVAKYDFFNQPKEWMNLDKARALLESRAISGTKEEIHGYTTKPLFPNTRYRLSDKHMKLYRKIVDEQLLAFPDGTVIDASTAGRLRQALQQVVCNFDHFSGDPEARSAAFDWIDLAVEEAEIDKRDKSKLIIWTRYKITSHKVLEYCNKLGLKSVGAFGSQDSAASVKAFETDPNTRILVANPQSAGAGLNPQYVCWEMLQLEFDTNPTLVRQTFGRVDRMGQKHVPRIRVAVAADTVQVGLAADLLRNDSLILQVDSDKKSLKNMLLGLD